MSKTNGMPPTLPMDEPERRAVMALHDAIPEGTYPAIKAAVLAVAQANEKGLPGLDGLGGFIVAYHFFQSAIETPKWLTLMAFLHRVERDLYETGPTVQKGS